MALPLFQTLGDVTDATTHYIRGTSFRKAFHIKFNDAQVITSGYNSCMLWETTNSGAKTNTEWSAARFNMTLAAAPGSIANSFKIKVSASGSPTLTGAQVYGLAISVSEIGDCSMMSALLLEMYNTTDVTNSFFLLCKHQGGSPKVDSMFGMFGAKPDLFLKAQTNDPNGFWTRGGAVETVHMGTMTCQFGSETGYINVWTS